MKNKKGLSRPQKDTVIDERVGGGIRNLFDPQIN